MVIDPWCYRVGLWGKKIIYAIVNFFPCQSMVRRGQPVISLACQRYFVYSLNPLYPPNPMVTPAQTSQPGQFLPVSVPTKTKFKGPQSSNSVHQGLCMGAETYFVTVECEAWTGCAGLIWCNHEFGKAEGIQSVPKIPLRHSHFYNQFSTYNHPFRKCSYWCLTVKTLTLTALG